MAGLIVKPQNKHQVKVLEKLREKLSQAGFGVTLSGMFLTVRFTDNSSSAKRRHYSVTTAITDVDPDIRKEGRHACDVLSDVTAGSRPRCSFDPIADPALDNCLYCGLPNTRK